MTTEPLKAKRRIRSKQERRQIAEESLAENVSVAVIARSHGVNANQVFHWRKLLQQGRLELKARPSTELMPVRIAEVAGDDRFGKAYAGTIRIEVGRTRIQVEGSADPESLRLILEHLSQ